MPLPGVEAPGAPEGAADDTGLAPISTERLLLTPFNLADTDEHDDALIRDPQVARWLPSGLPGTPPTPPRSAQRSPSTGSLSATGTTSRFLGRCGLRYLPQLDDTELLYGLHLAGLTSLIGLVLLDNVASRRVLEHAGMTAENDLVEVFALRLTRLRIRGAGQTLSRRLASSTFHAWPSSRSTKLLCGRLPRTRSKRP